MGKKNRLIAVSAIVVAVFAGTLAHAESLSQPLTAAMLLRSVGVNCHLGTFGSNYGPITDDGENPNRLISMLNFLGVSLIRTGIPGANGAQNAPVVWAEYGQLAKSGIRFDLEIVSPAELLQKTLSVVRFSQVDPGAVVAIEGLNEVEFTSKGSYGLRGPADVEMSQMSLYQTVRSYPSLAKVSVINFSVHPDIQNPSETFQSNFDDADDLNVHSYPLPGDTPGNALSARIAVDRGLLNNRPLVITEGGFPTGPRKMHPGAVPEDIKAKYILDFLCDGFRSGAKAIYIYELIDSRNDKPNQYNGENHFGLFNSDGSPKFSAQAFHNWSEILAENAQTGGFELSTLSYQVEGLPSNGGVLLIQKRLRTFDLIIWAEPRLWDPKKFSEITPTKSVVKIFFRDHISSYALYDPMLGTDASLQGRGNTAVGVTIMDHPVILEVVVSA